MSMQNPKFKLQEIQILSLSLFSAFSWSQSQVIWVLCTIFFVIFRPEKLIQSPCGRKEGKLSKLTLIGSVWHKKKFDTELIRHANSLPFFFIIISGQIKDFTFKQMTKEIALNEAVIATSRKIQKWKQLPWRTQIRKQIYLFTKNKMTKKEK